MSRESHELTRRFREEHARIGEIADAIGVLVRDGAPPDTPAVAPLRWRLARELTAHLAVEDRILYPRLLTSESPAVAATARRFKAEMGDLASVFTAYMTDWTPQRISSEWTGFCAATRALLVALAQRVDREDSQLYPLAEHHG